MVKPFPSIKRQMSRKGEEDYNPAIQVFGRRFFADQTVPELLLELLLVATSRKRVRDEEMPSERLLPSIGQLQSWPSSFPLEYAPKARLNLKLFAFINASKLDTRHDTHRQHYKELVQRLSGENCLSVSDGTERADVVKTLENLFLGFQTVGGQRTWCAQAFLPISRNLIGAETLWNQTDAERAGVTEWASVIERFQHFFSFGRHRFLARGGELLYLQICNALRQTAGDICAWLDESGIGATASERMPEQVHVMLEHSLTAMFDDCPDTVNHLARFIESGIEQVTAHRTDFDQDTQAPRFTACGWCPEESWPEGYLFVVELVRLCGAVVDPIERLELLEIACAMQVLRSLCAQSARYGRHNSTTDGAGPLGYVWVVSDPLGRHAAVKQISRRSLGALQKMIYDAIRHPTVHIDDKDLKLYGEADKRYGYKLFLTLAKRLGLVIPRRGSGARIVLNERLLRYLVLSTIRPGERVTYASFKKLLFAHHGLAIDDESIGQACRWSGTSRLTSLGGDADSWLVDMLDASGMLIKLSDACSLVRNPFDGAEGAK